MRPSSLPLALLILASVTPLHAQSPPGKPKVTHCRSFDKETATCWWELGSDGGLPTKHTFLSWSERNETHVECSDYDTSGQNSCFFDKSHTALWIYYYAYVNSTNALGSTVSDVLQFELEKIVKTFPPRNLTVMYETNTSTPYLLASWRPPEKFDVDTGWVTLQYELQLMDVKKQKQENHVVDHQTMLKVFSLTPGEDYLVQVRCQADGSNLWSDWSEAKLVTIPGAQSPPGKPKVTNCQSYDKETATCWWEPGSDGGLPTKHTFLYWTEKNETHVECSDYDTSGQNSCFFDKSHTTLWIYYYTCVNSTNALGSTVSDVHQFELEKIVKTFPPRNLTVMYDANKTIPYLMASWISPEKVNVKIGWLTLQYELQLIDVKKQNRENHVVDHKTKLKVFSLTPGEDYLVQVRCKTRDSNIWSDWSEAKVVTIPGAQSLPGKPKVTHCQSYDKETATCWWDPGSDGGLPTKCTFFYWTEKNDTHIECSDYDTSGQNSCFFDKSHTALWMYYYTYVNSTNALGTTMSDVHQFEIEKIVKTFPPQNLTVMYETNKTTPYLLASWRHPPKVDVKIGWVTLQYELQLIDVKKQKRENHVVDHQTKLKVFSLTPGEDYLVQVRCQADGSELWSDWSEAKLVTIPGGETKRDLTLWISIAVLSVIICLTMIWTMALKGCSWMSCICPPVPGPKIMGFDTQLLKSGKAEDLLSAFGCQGFPPTSDCKDLLVEFLEVDDSKEHLIPNSERDLQSHHMKVSQLDTDNDSGRGSCDSHFASSEGSKDHSVLQHGFESFENTTHGPFMTKCPWPPQNPLMDTSFSNFSDKSYIWSDGMADNNPSPKSSYHNITDVCKMALGTVNANMSAFFMPNEEKNQHAYFRTIETIDEEGLNKQNDFGDKHSKGMDPEKLLLLTNKTSFMPPRTMDYVEVHNVNQNDALALIPKHKEISIKPDQYSALVANGEYSKVERVDGNNVLVLMPNLEVQVSPSSGDNVKEFVQKPQESQAEKLMGFIRPARNEGNTNTAGMGYMDPSMFLP